MNDYQLFKKAKNRVSFRLVFSWFLLILYFIGVIYVLNIDQLKVLTLPLNKLLLISSIGQLFLFAFLFFLLSFGKKFFRILYWIVILLTLSLYYIPIKLILIDMQNIFSYGVLLGCMFIKTLFLIRLGSYLKRNKWARIYFDHIVEVDEEERIEPVHTIPKKVDTRPVLNSIPKENIFEEEEEEPYTLPQISIRLGICIYASLMIFPIFVQLCSNFFSSYDMQTVFATKDIFMLCIFTALVWTIPVFYLYYNHEDSKRVVLICAILEILCIIFYTPKFIGYYTSASPKYPLRVFLLFIVVDILRYLALAYSIKPLKDIEIIKDDYEE